MNIALTISKVGETYLTWYIGQWAMDNLQQVSEQKKFAFTIFGFAIMIATAEFFRSKIVSIMIFNAGNRVHTDLIKSVLAAPINTFFDVTPTGLIINRFSKDLS